MEMYIIVLYALLVIALAFWSRRHVSGDDYLMAERKASGLFVAASLFTLIGGGELVALTALSYTYGFYGVSLFLGYAAAFVFVGVMAPRIREDNEKYFCLSLPDFVHEKYGVVAGRVVFLFSFLAFFALLLLQFSAGASVIAPLVGINYHSSVFIIAGIVATYLVIGGFRTVLLTDVVQGAAMMILMPLIGVAILMQWPTSVNSMSLEAPQIGFVISLILTGFFVGAVSSDVWQRAYAARSNAVARSGFIWGAAALLVFGIILSAVGIIAHHVPGITSGDTAFIDIMRSLPEWGLYVGVVVVLSAILSTADTEMFLLSGMVERERIRVKRKLSGVDIAKNTSIASTRVTMAVITVSAVVLSLVFRDLVSIYTWILSALIVISPVVILGLFSVFSQRVFVISVLLNSVVFFSLIYFGMLTLEFVYIIFLPGFIICLLMIWWNNCKKWRMFLNS